MNPEFKVYDDLNDLTNLSIKEKHLNSLNNLPEDFSGVIMENRVVENTNELINKYELLSKKAKGIKDYESEEMIKFKEKMKKFNDFLKKDIILIIFIYEDEFEEILKCKEFINEKIRTYRKHNLDYMARIYTWIDYEKCCGCDSFFLKNGEIKSNEVMLNAMYSRQTVFHIPRNKEEINYKNRDKLLSSLKGCYKDLEQNVELIKDSKYFSIFEYNFPN